MASGTQLLVAGTAARCLIVGWPGSGKTGSVCALLNAGYKVRMIDFEGNYAPLTAFTDPRGLANLDILTFQDRYHDNGSYLEPIGIPSAFNDALKALQEWKYADANGQIVNLGKSADWGPDTVVVVDSLTALGEACFRRARKMMNKTPRNTTAAVWGAAVDDQIHFLQKLNAETNRYHVVVLGHLQMIGPQAPMSSKDEESEVKDLKMQAAVEAADLLPTRLYPRAVTKNASMAIHKEFPTMLLAERRVRLHKTVRVLTHQAGTELDLKFPVKNPEIEYPIETGLASIFEKLGAKAPGWPK